MDHILRLNEFFVAGGKQDISHVLLHITEPSTPEEMSKGYFFAIAEINKAETKYITKLQALIDQAENDYYELPDEPNKTSLELVIEKMNQETLGLASAPIELHCIVGAIRQPEIIFTYYGHPEMILLYKNNQGVYQKMDLIKNDEDVSAEPNQLFANIIQGKISSNDFLFAGTPHITDYFNHDRLQKIITSRPAVQSAQHIERVLSEVKNGLSFGGLIMHIDRPDSGPIPVRKAPAIVKGASSKSLHSLFDRERSTSQTLSSSLLPRWNERIKRLFNRDENAKDEMNVPIEPTPTPAEINSAHVSHRSSGAAKPKIALKKKMTTILDFTIEALKTIGRGLGTILFVIYSIIYGIIRSLILLVFLIGNIQNRRQSIIEDWRRTWRSYRENIRQLPLLTKVLLSLSIIIAGIFIGSISFVRYRQTETARQKTFADTIQLIKTKKDSMESALIYKDNNAALKELTSAEDLLTRLDCITTDEKKNCTDLASQLDAVTTRIHKVIAVTPEVVVNWSSIDAPITNLIRVGTKLIAYSNNTSTLFVYDLLTKESKVIPTLPTITGFTRASVPKENDYVAFLANAKDVILFNPTDDTLKSASISYSNPKVLITDLVVYSRRLYTLDALNSQIYRHDSTKNGFGQGKDWIKDGTSIKDATSLTIDGDMFVLEHGNIVKFTSGVSQVFDFEGIDPPLADGGNTLATYTDWTYLYILDGANNHLVVLGKDGTLKEQIKPTGLTNPSGVAIDQQNNTAYLVDANKVVKITIPQPQ